MTYRGMPNGEVAVYGRNAALAVFRYRPEHIVRVYYSSRNRGIIGDLLRYCAQCRLPYRELSDYDLSRVAKTEHHEGLVVVAFPKRFLALDDLLDAALDPASVFVALENVENPHNLGAIVRSAAAFDIRGLIVAGDLVLSGRIAPATLRVAEGGAEFVPIAAVADMEQALLYLKHQGICTVATDAHTGSSVFSARIPRPVTIVFGNEREGTQARIRSRCDQVVRIPTTGMVESLNVSVAAAVIMAEMWRTR